MVHKTWHFLWLFIITGMIQSCNSNESLLSTDKVLVSSESGDKLSLKENMRFQSGEAKGIVLTIDPDRRKQTMDGIGSSFTESSAYVLAHLEPEERMKVMEAIYGPKGIKLGVIGPNQATLIGLARQLLSRGADLVLAGCTEVELALSGCKLPLVDPLRVLAREAVFEAGAVPRKDWLMTCC